MLKCGFFNSIDGDRVYGAEDLNNFFEGIISDGIFRNYKRELKVTAPGGMTVRVLTGKAICLEKYIDLTSAEDLTIEGGNAQPRYDAVVINTNLEDRSGYIYIKQGAPSATPTPPALYDNETTKEMALAYVYVPANATEIIAENITDKREDSSVCGWVKLTNVSATLITYRSNVTAQAAVTELNVDISEYNEATDIVTVYKNGFLLDPGTDYTITETGSAAKIKLASSTPAGNEFTFIVQHLGLV